MPQKLYVVLIYITFVGVFIVGDVKVKQNTSDPIGAYGEKSGNSVQLNELMRITDNGQNFIFKKINQIRIAEDGSVFVASPDQLYRFNQKGILIRKFIRKGAGPGEVIYFSNFALADKAVIVGGFKPTKLIKFTFEGNLKNEKTIRDVLPSTVMLGQWNGRVYFISRDRNLRNAKSGINQRINEIVYSGDDGIVVRTGLKFTTLDIMKPVKTRHGPVVITDELTSMISVFDQSGFLYISYKERYEIIQIDLSTNKIIRTFNRHFRPIEYKKKHDLDKYIAELHSVHNYKYYNDIYQLAICGKNLLVFTSVLNKKKEVMVDVFNQNGEYIDRFFIRIPKVERPDDLRGKPVFFQNGYFWTTGRDEDDTPFVLKYKLKK